MNSTTRWAATTLILALTTQVAAAQFSTPGSTPSSKLTSQTNCKNIGGAPSIGTTMDDGTSWATSKRPMPKGQGSFGLAVVRGSNRILAEFMGKIYSSKNGGCNWQPIGTISGSPLRLVGSGSRAYAWNFFNSQDVWRIDLDAPGPNKIVKVKGLPEDVIALGVDPVNDLHVRGVGRNGGIFETFNGGQFWSPVGTSAPTTPLVYFAAFDSADINHIVVGMVTNGVVTTFDGGSSWTFASGLSQTGGARNSFMGVVSEADPFVVWVESIDIDESSGGAPSGGKHIYRSSDGGLSFTPVVDAGNGVVLTNGAALAADPNNRDLIYVPFGSTVFGLFLDLYRYDHATGQLTQTTTTISHTKVRSMVFDPQHPGRIVAAFEGS
jgi:hypothetical protein